MERVDVLARARRAINDETSQSLNSALRQVCEALHAQAELRSILVTSQAGNDLDGLSASCMTTLALVVNELVTNALKHAFEEGKGGNIRASVGTTASHVTVFVDDDGLPFPRPGSISSGMGMGLAKRMMASIGGILIAPGAQSKVFELRVPVGRE